MPRPLDTNPGVDQNLASGLYFYANTYLTLKREAMTWYTPTVFGGHG
ncbi:hypothetical protein [Rhodohalobacter mucosus]|nr:hypothetical protein [Rhodohalobacter mucosus]